MHQGLVPFFDLIIIIIFFFASSLGPTNLAKLPQGVFTALSNMDWYQLVVPEAGVYTGPGVSSAIAANRISRLVVFGVSS